MDRPALGWSAKTCLCICARTRRSFPTTSAQPHANTVLDSLTSILWVVNGQGHKFQTTANVPTLPAALIFNGHRVLGHKKLPELSQRALSAAHNKLAAVLPEPRVRSAGWPTVRRDLEAMHASMVAYESYLVEQNNVQRFHHLSRQPVRPPSIGLAC
jgi:hypothetical protein